MKKILILGLALTAGPRIAFAAGTTLDFESGLGFTSNADLASEGAVGDGIFRVAGYAGFPIAETQARASVRFADYVKRDNNDLLSLDFGTKWELAGKGANDSAVRSFDLRVAVRDYVHEQAATTDVGFTHYGVIGRYIWRKDLADGDEFRVSPQVDVEHYPKFSNRNDVDLMVRFQRLLYSKKAKESFFDFEVSPGLLVSTASEFSKYYLAASVNYEAPIDDLTTWGAFFNLTPSFYTSRETDSVVLSTGRKRNATTVTVTEKERTLLVSPGVFWSRRLSVAWEFRADSVLNVQSSKSGTYGFTELQATASIRYRAL